MVPETVANAEGQPSGRGRSKAAKRRREVEYPKDPSARSEPGAEGHQSPGPYLQAQRKRRGMSLEQLAAVTKIPRGQLELLEADRYEELPGMVFTKGFLRCCARSLDLDPDTVLGLLYERERAKLRARRRETNNANGSPAALDGKPGRGQDAARSRRPATRRAGVVDAWLAQWIGKLPSARILMWLVVALLVALVVFIAFTLASGQAESIIIKS
ncbi:putative membrane protein [Enhygromyxa salina]|uniref:Putative membrane protein n=1 Tax=Enhygromyxa salina TaxID=215803 RepID=A0A0C1ZQV4_9BACT|nr:putative membrane protein [Enhygromyxa salina]